MRPVSRVNINFVPQYLHLAFQGDICQDHFPPPCPDPKHPGLGRRPFRSFFFPPFYAKGFANALFCCLCLTR